MKRRATLVRAAWCQDRHFLPAEFRALMHSTRGAFDSLASGISAGVGADTVVTRLAHITDNCLGCHATYRLEILPP